MLLQEKSNALLMLSVFSTPIGISIFCTHFMALLINYRYGSVSEMKTPYYWLALGFTSYVILWISIVGLIVIFNDGYHGDNLYVFVTAISFFLLETIVMYTHLGRFEHLTKNLFVNYLKAVIFSFTWYIVLFGAFYLPMRNVNF